MLAIASHSYGASNVNNLHNNKRKQNNGISEEVAQLRETLEIMQEWNAKIEARISQFENSTRSTQGTFLEFEERFKLLESKIKIQEFREKRMELLTQALERFLEENNNGQAAADKNIFFKTTPQRSGPAKISNLERLMASEKYRPILDFPTRPKTPQKTPPSSMIINNNYTDVPKEEKQDVTTLATSVPPRIDSEISQEIEKSSNSDDDFIELAADKARLNAQTTNKLCSLPNSGSQIIPISGKADSNCKENGRVDKNTIVGENPAATNSLNGTSTEKPRILQKSSRTMQCMDCEKTFGSSTTLRLHAITHNFPDKISEQGNPNNNSNNKFVTQANTKPSNPTKILVEKVNKNQKIANAATISLNKKNQKTNKSGAAAGENKIKNSCKSYEINHETRPESKIAGCKTIQSQTPATKKSSISSPLPNKSENKPIQQSPNKNKRKLQKNKNKKKVLKVKIPITPRRKSTSEDDEENISVVPSYFQEEKNENSLQDKELNVIEKDSISDFSAHSKSPEINNCTLSRNKSLQRKGNEATKTTEIIPCKKIKSSKIEAPPMDNRKDATIPEHSNPPSQSEVANFMEFMEAEDRRTEESQILECLICQKTCKSLRRLEKHLIRRHEM